MITAMDCLAHCCGIQDVSEDAFGKEHRTSAKTKRAVTSQLWATRQGTSRRQRPR